MSLEMRRAFAATETTRASLDGEGEVKVLDGATSSVGGAYVSPGLALHRLADDPRSKITCRALALDTSVPDRNTGSRFHHDCTRARTQATPPPLSLLSPPLHTQIQWQIDFPH